MAATDASTDIIENKLSPEGQDALIRVGGVLKSLGFEEAMNGQEGMRLAVKEAIPIFAKLPNFNLEETELTAEYINALEQNIKAFRETSTYRILTNQPEGTLSEEQIKASAFQILPPEAKAKELEKEGVPEELIPHIDRVAGLVKSPDRFLADLRLLEREKVFNPVPETPAQVTEATAEQTGGTVTDVAPVQSDTPDVTTPTPESDESETPETSESAPAEEPQPSTDTEEAKPPETLKDAVLAANTWLTLFSADMEGTVPAPGTGDDFDKLSQASAWALIADMKRVLNIPSQPGQEGLYDPAISQKLFEEGNKSFRDRYAKIVGGEKQLKEFFLSMDQLHIANKLATQNSAPQQQQQSGPLGVAESFKQARDLMVAFLGEQQANSIIGMIFAVAADLLGEFGIDIRPIVQRLGLDEVLGLSDEEGNPLTPEQRNTMLQEVFKKAYSEVSQDPSLNNDPQKIREAIKQKIEDEMGSGGFLERATKKVIDFFMGVKGKLNDAVDEAMKGNLSSEERAKIFADKAQGLSRDAAAEQNRQTGPAANSDQSRSDDAATLAVKPPGDQHPPATEQSGGEGSSGSGESGGSEDEEADADPYAGNEEEARRQAEAEAAAADPVVLHHSGLEIGQPDGIEQLSSFELDADDLKYPVVRAMLTGEGRPVLTVLGDQILVGRYDDGHAKVYDVGYKLSTNAQDPKVQQLIKGMVLVDSDGNPAVEQHLHQYYAAIKAVDTAQKEGGDRSAAVADRNKTVREMSTSVAGRFYRNPPGIPHGQTRVLSGPATPPQPEPLEKLHVKAGAWYRTGNGDYAVTQNSNMVVNTEDMRRKFMAEAQINEGKVTVTAPPVRDEFDVARHTGGRTTGGYALAAEEITGRPAGNDEVPATHDLARSHELNNTHGNFG